MELLAHLMFAFLGGIILNVMPCVFPVIMLKVNSFIADSKKGRYQAIRNSLMYCSGIIISFIALAAVVILLKSIGHEVSWGFQMQSPLVMYGMSVLFAAMGISYLGVFDLGTRISGTAANSVVRSGPFLNGVLASLVAAPCTGPLLGSVLAYALVADTPDIHLLAIFIAIGVGMAAPYLLLTLSRSASKALPRSGKWMVYIKNILGIVLILTSMWFAWAGTASDRVPKGWKPYTPSALEDAKKSGDPVFVYVTAKWCAICLANEVILFSDDVTEIFRKNKVVLLYGDYTHYSKDIKDLLSSVEHPGVPLYLVFKNGKIIKLAQLITTQEIKEAIEE